MTTKEDIDIYAMPTPNPNAIKFVVEKPFFEAGSFNFPTEEKAKASPLATKLFEIEGVSGVMIGTNFVSVSKEDDDEWDQLAEPITDAIKECIAQDIEIVDLEKWEKIREKLKSEIGDIEAKIIAILDNEIRPAVAMDGGDITFDSFDNGVVYLQLQGACSTCPSSTMTLKMGIENRLKQEIPEVKEVVQV